MIGLRCAAAVGLLPVTAACASSPDHLFTYAAQGVVIQAERLVGSFFGRASDPLPYTGPTIDQVLARMHQRFPDIRASLDEGVLGLTEDSDVQPVSTAVRLPAGTQHLMRAENRDRAVLYAAMAEAVGHQAYFVPYVDAAFGSEWQKQAPSGWWLRDEHGDWRRKP